MEAEEERWRRKEKDKEIERGLIVDLKRPARLAVAWGRHGAPAPRPAYGTRAAGRGRPPCWCCWRRRRGVDV